MNSSIGLRWNKLNNMVKKIIIILNVVSLIASLIWLMVDHSWEPLVTSLGLIISLITLIYNDRQDQSGTKMNQKGGKNSTNYQAAGDIKIDRSNE